MKKLLGITSIFILLAMAFTSCKKEDATQELSPAAKLLTGKTWQVDEVAYVSGGLKEISYKRGIDGNDEDFSLVRQTFHKNGTISYIDQFGDAGSNGKFQLMNNDTKLRLSMGDLSVVVENVTITAGTFSYRVINQDGYTFFTFTPAL